MLWLLFLLYFTGIVAALALLAWWVGELLAQRRREDTWPAEDDE
jgi:hypothetical protein